MTFEFTIVYQHENGTNIREILHERLHSVLEDNLNEFDHEITARMLRVNFERSDDPVTDDQGVSRTRTVLVFSVQLPDETASLRIVVDEFADALDAAPIEHAVKFEDPLLHVELAQRAEELFALELKLRRVLSVIYLHAYCERPYELLREEKMKPQPENNPPTPADMKTAKENEFFHLTFRQYGNLNQRPDITNKAPALLQMIEQTGTHVALLAELARKPIQHSDDAGFLASLRDSTHAIEAMRNCVAHYRRPPQELTRRYLNDLPNVHRDLDYFLENNRADWLDALGDDVEEDHRAREVIRLALEDAEWDDTARTVRIRTPEGDHITVHSREELERELRELASNEWHGHAMRIDGEYVGTCDDATWVSEALEEYEDRIESVFAADDEDGEE